MPTRSASIRFPQAEIREAFTGAIHALVSLVWLTLASPLFLLIAIAVKLTSRGPVFYRGDRVGRDGVIFQIYKFRTLAIDAEKQIGARLLTPEDRDRLATPLGRLLKKTKLDELPQLLNVLRGEMRLVGPRPVRPIFLEEFETTIPGYADRFAVPPGITGVAQLRGGYYTSPRDKLRYDRTYIANRTLLLDAKVLVLTGVKILERWLPAGAIIFFLLLFVSLVPAGVMETLELPILGSRVNPVYLVILLGAALAVFRRDDARIALHRGPLNPAIALFVALGFVGALFADDPTRYLKAVGYYVVSGFLVAFLIVNTLATAQTTALLVRVIALTAVAMSLVGLAQLLVLNGSMALASGMISPQDFANEYGRIASLFGNPMILAVYLALGIPLLFGEIARARTQGERDFWVACTTISIVGVVFTQTRIGLLALLVTGTFFLARRHQRAATGFFALFVAGFLVLGAAGVSRFSAERIGAEASEWVERQSERLRSIPIRDWVVGSGPQRSFWSRTDSGGPTRKEFPNMHLTLAWDHGVAAWVVTMGFVVAALRRMKRAYDRIHDERLRVQLWAIMAAIVGYLVSMNGMNTFHNLPLQIFFWSLVGIGLEIVNYATRSRSLIWRFGDAGD